MQKLEVLIDGMSCQHCVGRVKKALDVLKGVSSADVKVGSAVVDFDESVLISEAVVGAIEKAGYRIKSA